MNRRQKLVQEKLLNNEETVIKRLKGVYEQSLKDITGKISDLDKSIGALQKALADVDDDEIGDLAKAFLGRRANITPAEAKETLQSMIQSKVYQKRYQEALKGQIDGIMDKMHRKEYKIVSDYLKECYEDGFIGTMFDLQGQGIPLCFPLDQEAMVRAVQLDSKISHGLYTRLGEDVALLKKKITAQVSRGVATGMTYQQVARGLANYTNIGYNNAIRIARTEGHRIQVQGTMDACYKAKEKGADVVKQWDSTLDGRTRESHAQVDGEIRELDKRFSNGLMFPGDPSGGAGEVVNCRCALLQRAKWALDESELETLQKRAEYFGLDKSETFEDYKKTYLKAAGNLTNSDNDGKISLEKFRPAQSIQEARTYAKDVLGLDTTGYEGINLDVANMVNREIQNAYDIFGNIQKAGELSGIRILPTKKPYVAAYSKSLKEIYLTKNNVGYKSSIAKMAQKAKEQVGYGFWSGDAAEQTIRHEIGHAIQHMFTDPKAGNPYGNSASMLNKISALRNQIVNDCGITKWSTTDSDEHMQAAGSVISYYALRDDGEFIAECVAEYMGGRPRETAKKVVEILLQGG